MELHKKVLEQYAATRSGTYKQVVCHAPFVNLNFEQNGNVRACCYNTKDILGNWSQQTIREIWFSESAQKLRNHIRNNDLGGGCTECGTMIIAGNNHGVRAKYFDEFAPNNLSSRIHYFRNKLNGHINYPRVMEFELSNECNLECVMCNGYFSSSIRKNREKLSPTISPYNERFVDELDEFIPHLTDAKFLGGEPFMIEIYLKIWERILKINPSVCIHITTNGTFLNNRIKDLLEGLKAGIILSIDSVNKDTYEKIRVNGKYEKVMENMSYLLDYTKRKKTFISMAACPITYNWKELPQMLEFCMERNIALYFNAVFSPAELSLKEQSLAYQQEVISHLESYKLPEQKGNPQSPVNLSINAYRDFVNLLKGWVAESKLKSKNTPTKEYSFVETKFIKNETANWNLELLFEKIKALDAITEQGYVDKEVAFLNDIANLFVATPHEHLATVLKYYIQLGKPDISELEQFKATEIATLINNHAGRENILVQMSKASPKVLSQNLIALELEQMKKLLSSQFN
ncbi:MAG: twitch domain-containing radical SAM protein [Chitinophagales bacterium]|nr:twitch domain-containing radical SAM protein [Chitinophagales bacterium]